MRSPAECRQSVDQAATHGDGEFFRLCETIVTEVYRALGSQLSTDEAITLAGELASEVALALLVVGDDAGKYALVAEAAMLEFLKRKGVADMGEYWAWMN